MSSPEPTGAQRELSDGVIVTLAALLSAAALVHASIAPAHFAEWWGLGALFGGAAAAQLTLAVGLVRGWAGALPAVVGLQVTILAAWAVSRTVGLPLPLGPRVAETAGGLDGLTSLAEAVSLVLLAVSWGGRPPTTLTRRVGAGLQLTGWALAVVLSVAFTAGIGHD